MSPLGKKGEEAAGLSKIDAQEKPAGRSGKQRPSKKQKVYHAPVIPVSELMKSTSFFHARTHLPMKDAEVEQILKDPHSLPDSDDEEALDVWRVRSSLPYNISSGLEA